MAPRKVALYWHCKTPEGKYVLASYGDSYFKVPVNQSTSPVKANYPAHHVPVRWVASDHIAAVEENGFSEIDTIDIGSGEVVAKQPIQLPSDVESFSSQARGGQRYLCL